MSQELGFTGNLDALIKALTKEAQAAQTAAETAPTTNEFPNTGGEQKKEPTDAQNDEQLQNVPNPVGSAPKAEEGDDIPRGDTVDAQRTSQKPNVEPSVQPGTEITKGATLSDIGNMILQELINDEEKQSNTSTEKAAQEKESKENKGDNSMNPKELEKLAEISAEAVTAFLYGFAKSAQGDLPAELANYPVEDVQRELQDVLSGNVEETDPIDAILLQLLQAGYTPEDILALLQGGAAGEAIPEAATPEETAAEQALAEAAGKTASSNVLDELIKLAALHQLAEEAEKGEEEEESPSPEAVQALVDALSQGEEEEEEGVSSEDVRNALLDVLTQQGEEEEGEEEEAEEETKAALTRLLLGNLLK